MTERPDEKVANFQETSNGTSKLVDRHTWARMIFINWISGLGMCYLHAKIAKRTMSLKRNLSMESQIKTNLERVGERWTHWERNRWVQREQSDDMSQSEKRKNGERQRWVRRERERRAWRKRRAWSGRERRARRERERRSRKMGPNRKERWPREKKDRRDCREGERGRWAGREGERRARKTNPEGKREEIVTSSVVDAFGLLQWRRVLATLAAPTVAEVARIPSHPGRSCTASRSHGDAPGSLLRALPAPAAFMPHPRPCLPPTNLHRQDIARHQAETESLPRRQSWVIVSRVGCGGGEGGQ